MGPEPVTASGLFRLAKTRRLPIQEIAGTGELLRCFLFFGHFYVDPTGEIGENIIVEELRAAADTPGAFLLIR